MYCKKCGAVILNGERQCNQCGVELEGRGGAAVLTSRPMPEPPEPRPTSRLAVCFLGLGIGALACLLFSGAMVLLIDRSQGVDDAAWNLGLLGLTFLMIGFLLECSALIFGVLTAIRLYQDRHLRGRGLAWAALVLCLLGAGLFLALRTNPHFRPPRPALVPTPRKVATSGLFDWNLRLQN
jgi:membrane-associated phospholipid phosphatase